jgi:hypothetical protein
MTTGKLDWTFDAGARTDVLHLIDHPARAVDGDVGSVVLVSAQPNRSYLLVAESTLDRHVIVPAGSIASMGSDGAINLCLTQEQIAAAPAFESARRNERDYFDVLAAYFAPLLAGARGRRLRRCARAA